MQTTFEKSIPSHALSAGVVYAGRNTGQELGPRGHGWLCQSLQYSTVAKRGSWPTRSVGQVHALRATIEADNAVNDYFDPGTTYMVGIRGTF